MKPAALRPLRTSLVTETARALRQGIESGQWKEFLPGERNLCAQWQISRPTLRAAVDLLRREKLLEVGHGRRTRLLERHEAPTPGTLTVGLLSPESLEAMPPKVMLWVDELRGQLASAGHLLQVTLGRAGFGKKNPARALEAVVGGTPATPWVLYQATEAMQQWFEGSKVPCIVVGSTFDGVRLPSVDRDYRASCRHAAGLLAQRGHKRIAFLIQDRQFGGDLESERGFTEGLEVAAKRGVAGDIRRHDGTPAGVCSQLDALLAETPRCTALLVARTGFALSTFSHLLRRGVRVPQDMALLCRDDDSFLDHLIPRMARYGVSPAQFAKRLYRLVLKLVEDGYVKEGNVKVMPSFLKRESL